MKQKTLFKKNNFLARVKCDGAESCWNLHGLRSKCLSTLGFITAFKTFFDTIRLLF